MKNRLLGIDLFKGIAAYAVIMVHSGDETWGIPIKPEAEYFRLLFYFAVPFFLATSFYLMVNKAKNQISRKFWLSRIERILIPYIIWTVAYITLKLAVFPLTNQIEQIDSILQDKLGIIFFGAASYHLYFLPLIFTGSLLIFLARELQNKRVSLKYMGLLLILSLAAYQILVWSGNSFRLGQNSAFSSLLQFLEPDSISYVIARIFFVLLAWLIRCLPYLLAALIYVRMNLSQFYLNQNINTFIIFLFFIIIDTVGKLILPSAIWEIMVSFSLLSLSITLSKHIRYSRLITSLGKCSFGIYLIHPLIKSIIELLLVKASLSVTQSVTINSMMVYSVLTFVFSWYAVSLTLKNKLIAKYMFGA